MAESGRQQERAELVAVFPDRDAAQRAAEQLDAAGVSGIDIDASMATVARGEMEEEIDHGWAGGLIGVFVPDEMARPALALTIGFAIVGAIVGAVVTAVAMSFDPLWGRALIGAVVGALFLGTVGGVVGGGMGSRHEHDDLGPSEHPVAVRVVGESSAARETLAQLKPVRIDRFVDGQYQATVTARDTPPASERLGQGIADPDAR